MVPKTNGEPDADIVVLDRNRKHLQIAWKKNPKTLFWLATPSPPATISPDLSFNKSFGINSEHF